MFATLSFAPDNSNWTLCEMLPLYEQTVNIFFILNRKVQLAFTLRPCVSVKSNSIHEFLIKILQAQWTTNKINIFALVHIWDDNRSLSDINTDHKETINTIMIIPKKHFKSKLNTLRQPTLKCSIDTKRRNFYLRQKTNWKKKYYLALLWHTFSSHYMSSSQIFSKVVTVRNVRASTFAI